MSVFKSLKDLEHTVVDNAVLFNNDCFKVFPQIQDKSIDMILCDLPYGTTACKWDTILPFDKLWEQYERIIKDNGAIVLFGAEPFSSLLRVSNIKLYKYDWVWEKSKASGYLNAKKQPMRAHENILIFYRKPCVYNPQFKESTPYNKGTAYRPTDVYGQQVATEVKSDGKRYPRSVQYFVTSESEGKLHPTQKPVALMEYLIKTYTNENELVLDNCFGSNTTGVACKNLNRKYIGVEMDKNYFEIGVKRLKTD